MKNNFQKKPKKKPNGCARGYMLCASYVGTLKIINNNNNRNNNIWLCQVSRGGVVSPTNMGEFGVVFRRLVGVSVPVRPVLLDLQCYPVVCAYMCMYVRPEIPTRHPILHPVIIIIIKWKGNTHERFVRNVCVYTHTRQQCKPVACDVTIYRTIGALRLGGTKGVRAPWRYSLGGEEILVKCK